jgi:hypothetical protein
MALQVNLPMATVPAAKAWRPSSGNITLGGRQLPVRYDTAASLLTLAAWVAVPLFLAGVSGLLKKEK